MGRHLTPDTEPSTTSRPSVPHGGVVSSSVMFRSVSSGMPPMIHTDALFCQRVWVKNCRPPRTKRGELLGHQGRQENVNPSVLHKLAVHQLALRWRGGVNSRGLRTTLHWPLVRIRTSSGRRCRRADGPRGAAAGGAGGGCRRGGWRTPGGDR